MIYTPMTRVFCGIFLVTCCTVCDAEFEFLATHPEAVLQETSRGQGLHTLHAVEGKLFVGYGDYAFDTGPIALRYYDPAQEAFSASLGISNTEAVHRIQNVGSQVFALTSDPLDLDPGGYLGGQVDNPSSWMAVESLPFAHVYDLASLEGDQPKLFLSGSGGPTSLFQSVVYASSDGGDSWQLSLDVGLPEGVTGGNGNFSRFYGAAELNGQVYVQQVLFQQGIAEPLALFQHDGESWTELAPPTTPEGDWTRFIDPEPFGDLIIARDNHPGESSEIFQFDGTDLVELHPAGLASDVEFLDQYVAGGSFYLLTDDQQVIVSTDLVEWQTMVEDVPSSYLSLAVIGNDIYFGTTDSMLYRYAIAVPEPAGAGGIVACLAFCLAGLRGRATTAARG